MTKSRGEKGQAVPIMVIALSLLLVGGMGLAIDGAHLYNELQMAQVAADAAATAGIMSMFQGSNTVGATTYFDTSQASITCTTTDTQLPCQYARMNGFGSSANDTVKIEFPTCTGTGGNPAGPCGYAARLSPSDSPNQIKVTVTRQVTNSIIQMLGAALQTPIQTSATAAIVVVESPTPIIVTHPTLASSLNENGTSGGLIIIGGPTQSIQVNSNNSAAFGGAQIDLSLAGPGGNGANFGTYGGPADGSYSGNINFGTLPGHYIQPHSPILDPYRNVSPPSEPTVLGTVTSISSASTPNRGCQFTAAQGGCKLYTPGLYGDHNPPNSCKIGGVNCLPFDLSGSGAANPQNVIFQPGVYYVKGGGVTIKFTQGGSLYSDSTGTHAFGSMCYGGAVAGCNAADPDTGNGILIYDTGVANAGGFSQSGGVQMTTQNNIIFVGTAAKTTTNAAGQTVPDQPYFGLLFFEDRSAVAHQGGGPTGAHSLGQGNGCFTVVGTIYMTNLLSIMQNDAAHYQAVNFGGTPCGNTQSLGDIIVSTLNFNGNVKYKMTLQPYGFLNLRQVALVAGGPHP